MLSGKIPTDINEIEQLGIEGFERFLLFSLKWGKHVMKQNINQKSG